MSSTSWTLKQPITWAAWVEDALCLHFDPTLWDGENARKTKIAQKICARCPVQTACLQEALDVGEKWTVRAGKVLGEPKRNAS